MSGFVTIEQTGASIEQVVARQLKALVTANKTVGKEIASKGRKAMLADTKSRRGTLSFGGGKLNIRARNRSQANGVLVEFAGQSVGAWSIISHGTKSYPIRHLTAKALHWGSDAYAASVQHPAMPGRNYWQTAGVALDKVVAEIIDDTYGDALAAA